MLIYKQKFTYSIALMNFFISPIVPTVILDHFPLSSNIMVPSILLIFN